MKDIDKLFEDPIPQEKAERSIEQNVIQHVQGDMSPDHIAASGQFTPSVEGSALEGAMLIAGSLWDALTPAFEKGAEELMKGIYIGNAFDFHGSTFPENEQPKPGLPIEPLQKEEDRGMEL